MRAFVFVLLLASCNQDSPADPDLAAAVDLSGRPDLFARPDAATRHCRKDRNEVLQCGARQCPLGAWCDQRDPANPVCRCGEDVTNNTPDCICGAPISSESPDCREGPAGCA